MTAPFDVIVVGAGHAGCEAALASARMGMRTLLLTIRLDTIAQMSCNPAIGGLAKGQLVREVDALGGEMGKVTDATGIQFRMLNRGKGPAVHSPRAQSDRHLYAATMRQRLEAQDGLTLAEDIAEGLIVEGGAAAGVTGVRGEKYRGRAVILTTGTFLRGLIHVGPDQTAGGRINEPAAQHLSSSLRAAGLELERLKTGTPPRLDGRTIDYSGMIEQHGDDEPQPFSFSTELLDRPDVPCWITHTNPRTHEILLANLSRAPLYTGQIESAGPRYCPSIETKIVRFPDKDQHQIFIEPEGERTPVVYCNGISTSVPRDVQDEMVRSIAGLERATIARYGYAIEYDFVPPTQTRSSLESKAVRGLFVAGQINGTSGYEEAAAQGLMAGINAVLMLRGEEPFVLDRSEAYIGVMIDDLVTRGVDEPYRMFTSRAEYRLLLRQDNADRRLMKHGRRLGLVDDATWEKLEAKERGIAELTAYLERTRHESVALAQILRRPEVAFADVARLDAGLAGRGDATEVCRQVEIELKYAGYIDRQRAEVERFRRIEGRRIPDELDYFAVPEMRHEAKEKFTRIRPASLGQASRISGITPADITILMIYLEGRRGGSR